MIPADDIVVAEEIERFGHLGGCDNDPGHEATLSPVQWDGRRDCLVLETCRQTLDKFIKDPSVLINLST